MRTILLAGICLMLLSISAVGQDIPQNYDGDGSDVGCNTIVRIINEQDLNKVNATGFAMGHSWNHQSPRQIRPGEAKALILYCVNHPTNSLYDAVTDVIAHPPAFPDNSKFMAGEIKCANQNAILDGSDDDARTFAAQMFHDAWYNKTNRVMSDGDAMHMILYCFQNPSASVNDAVVAATK